MDTPESAQDEDIHEACSMKQVTGTTESKFSEEAIYASDQQQQDSLVKVSTPATKEELFPLKMHEIPKDDPLLLLQQSLVDRATAVIQLSSSADSQKNDRGLQNPSPIDHPLLAIHSTKPVETEVSEAALSLSRSSIDEEKKDETDNSIEMRETCTSFTSSCSNSKEHGAKDPMVKANNREPPHQISVDPKDLSCKVNRQCDPTTVDLEKTPTLYESNDGKHFGQQKQPSNQSQEAGTLASSADCLKTLDHQFPAKMTNEKAMTDLPAVQSSRFTANASQAESGTNISSLVSASTSFNDPSKDQTDGQTKLLDPVIGQSLGDCNDSSKMFRPRPEEPMIHDKPKKSQIPMTETVQNSHTGKMRHDQIPINETQKDLASAKSNLPTVASQRDYNDSLKMAGPRPEDPVIHHKPKKPQMHTEETVPGGDADADADAEIHCKTPTEGMQENKYKKLPEAKSSQLAVGASQAPNPKSISICSPSRKSLIDQNDDQSNFVGHAIGHLQRDYKDLSKTCRPRPEEPLMHKPKVPVLQMAEIATEAHNTTVGQVTLPSELAITKNALPGCFVPAKPSIDLSIDRKENLCILNPADSNSALPVDRDKLLSSLEEHGGESHARKSEVAKSRSHQSENCRTPQPKQCENPLIDVCSDLSASSREDVDRIVECTIGNHLTAMNAVDASGEGNSNANKQPEWKGQSKDTELLQKCLERQDPKGNGRAHDTEGLSESCALDRSTTAVCGLRGKNSPENNGSPHVLNMEEERQVHDSKSTKKVWGGKVVIAKEGISSSASPEATNYVTSCLEGTGFSGQNCSFLENLSIPEFSNAMVSQPTSSQKAEENSSVLESTVFATGACCTSTEVVSSESSSELSKRRLQPQQEPQQNQSEPTADCQHSELNSYNADASDDAVESSQLVRVNNKYSAVPEEPSNDNDSQERGSNRFSNVLEACESIKEDGIELDLESSMLALQKNITQGPIDLLPTDEVRSSSVDCASLSSDSTYGERTEVYVKDDAHGWLPANVLEHHDDYAFVSVTLPEHWNDSTVTFKKDKTSSIHKSIEAVDDIGRVLESHKVPAGSLRRIKWCDYKDGFLPFRNMKGSKRDMVDLEHLDEAAILFNLKERHFQSQPYTRVGDILVAMNPFTWIESLYTPNVQGDYAERIIWNDIRSDQNDSFEYKGTYERLGVEPHVYEISSRAYRGLALDRKDQTIVVTGESGAGKTETVKILMSHISAIPQTREQGVGLEVTKPTEIVSRVCRSSPIFEAFGNAKTLRNDNSSRFGKFTRLQFALEAVGEAKRSGKDVPCADLVGGDCTTYLLEKSRVVRHSLGERTYHIFYQLLASPTTFKEQLWPFFAETEVGDFKYLAASGDISSRHSDGYMWQETVNALELFQFEGVSLIDLMRALGIVLQLGNLVFDQNADNDFEEHNTVISSRTELERLSSMIGINCEDLEDTMIYRVLKTVSDEVRVKMSPQVAKESCDALAKEIYARIFDTLVRRINKYTSVDQNVEKRPLGYIALLDIFGFECFKVNRFEQLCINYANEKLQRKYVLDNFDQVKREYEAEGIDLYDFSLIDNRDLIELLEGRSGLIESLNAECHVPHGRTDESFVYKSIMSHQKSPYFIHEKLFDKTEFGIRHFAGPVVYNAHKFVECNMDKLPQELMVCASRSTNSIIQAAFDGSCTDTVSNTPTKGMIKKNRFVLEKFKTQLWKLISTLKNSRSLYIRCIKPNKDHTPRKTDHVCTMQQLEYSGLLTAVAITREIFPTKLTYGVIMERYACLMRGKGIKHTGNMGLKEKVDRVLSKLLKPISKQNRDGSRTMPFVCGNTRVYFKAGAQECLEASRLECLHKASVILQTWTRKVQHMNRFSLVQQSIPILQRFCRTSIQKIRLKREKSATRLAAWMRTRWAIRQLTRMRIAKREMEAATSIQKQFRRTAAMKEYAYVLTSIVVLQNFLHTKIQRIGFNRKKRSAMLIASIVRRWLAVKRAESIRRETAAVQIQVLARVFLAMRRTEGKRREKAASKIQARCRTWRQSSGFRRVKGFAILIQRRYRKHHRKRATRAPAVIMVDETYHPSSKSMTTPTISIDDISPAASDLDAKTDSTAKATSEDISWLPDLLSSISEKALDILVCDCPGKTKAEF